MIPVPSEVRWRDRNAWRWDGMGMVQGCQNRRCRIWRRGRLDMLTQDPDALCCDKVQPWAVDYSNGAGTGALPGMVVVSNQPLDHGWPPLTNMALHIIVQRHQEQHDDKLNKALGGPDQLELHTFSVKSVIAGDASTLGPRQITQSHVKRVITAVSTTRTIAGPPSWSPHGGPDTGKLRLLLPSAGPPRVG